MKMYGGVMYKSIYYSKELSDGWNNLYTTMALSELFSNTIKPTEIPAFIKSLLNLTVNSVHS
jgi:hypothetical protein